MAIQVGDRFPEVTLKTMTEGGIEDVSTVELTGGKKVVLFAVPGAFTPTCSDTHLPGFQVNVDRLKAKGVDTIACVATNDIFVVAAWAKARSIGSDILMLADGNGDLARALDLQLDIRHVGLGIRSRRFAAVIDDGEVTYLGVEPAGAVGVSGAEAVLEQL